MDVFAPSIELDRSQRTSQDGAATLLGSLDTTVGATTQNVLDANGIARTPQLDHLATSLGLGSVSPFTGGVAIGAYSSALALGTTALGYHASAKVSSSLAIGDQAAALAYRAIAFGKNTNATGTNSISMGSFSKSTNASTIAIGNAAVASGKNSIALGQGAKAAGTNAIAIGTLGQANATDDIVMGNSSTVTHTSVIALGNTIVSDFANCVLIGTNVRSAQANAFVAGAPGFPMTDVWFGQGGRVPTTGLGGTIKAWTLHGEEAGGGPTGGANTNANKAGGDLNICAGRSTGTALGGTVNIQTTGPGTLAEVLATPLNVLSITPNGVTAALPITATGPLFVTGAQAQLVVSGPSGSMRGIIGRTSGTDRWWLRMPNDGAEGSGDAGGDFDIVAWGNTGTFIDVPLSITRAAGGAINLYRFTNVHAPLFASELDILPVSGGASLFLYAPLGQARNILGLTQNVGTRWNLMLGNSAPETGGDAGADFQLFAYNDAGNVIDPPLGIVRKAGGTIFLQRPVSIGFDLAVSGNLTVSGGITGFGNTAGSYAPVFTPLSNVSAATGTLAWYLRVANVVTVDGYGTFTPVGPGAISFNISLPVGSAFTTLTQGYGQWRDGSNNGFGDIQSNNSNGTMNVFGNVTGTGGVSRQFRFSFSYSVV